MCELEQLQERSMVERDIQALEDAFTCVIGDITDRESLVRDFASKMQCMGRKLEMIGRELQNNSKYLRECV